MSGPTKIAWAAAIMIFAAAAVASSVVTALDTGVQYIEHTTNAGELTVDTLVGQTFTASRDNLAAVSVVFATYSNRNNTEPVLFYLRSSIDSSENIRVGEVDPRQLGDNQAHRFEFEPIPNSKDQQFFFFVVSPTSYEGNAVTVDLDTRDPYHLGSAYVVRGQGSRVTDPVILQKSGKITQDTSFALHYEVPLRVVMINKTKTFIRNVVTGWDTNRGVYVAYMWGAAAAAIILAVAGLMQDGVYRKIVARIGKKPFTIGLLLFLFVAGMAFRIRYATELPVTNDEGNYLYDAISMQRGILAGGDGYVKTPLVIAWVALWQVIFGTTILAGRMSSVVAGALTMFPIYFLAKELWSSQSVTRRWVVQSGKDEYLRWGRRIGLIAAALWAVNGSAVVSTIYVHTQPLALLFGVTGLAVLAAALRGNTPSSANKSIHAVPSHIGWFILAGVLLGLGVASRKSILALGLVPLVMILFEGRSWRLRLNHFLSVGIGFLIVLGLFLGSANYFYGAEGVREALGVNSAEDGLSAVTPDEVDQVRAYSLRGMTPFFRESLPLILLSVLGLGFALEYGLRTTLRKVTSESIKTVVSRLGWIAGWGVFIWAWSFFFEYEGALFMQFGIPFIWWSYIGVVAVAMLWPTKAAEKEEVPREAIVVPVTSQPGFHGQARQNTTQSVSKHTVFGQFGSAAFAVPLWVIGLIVFYVNWIKFHANYISEFIPPLIILSAFGLAALLRRISKRQLWHSTRPFAEVLRRLVMWIVIAIIAFAITTSNYITFFFEHTGTFHQGSVAEAVTWMQENIPIEDPIFTGAGLLPYLSGHRIALDIAHPRWYAYEFTRKDTERINTFLPPIEEMVQAYRDSNWFLLESQTGFSYLMEYSEIEGGLERDWKEVIEFENGGNPLKIYQRIRR